MIIIARRAGKSVRVIIRQDDSATGLKLLSIWPKKEFQAEFGRLPPASGDSLDSMLITAKTYFEISNEISSLQIPCAKDY